MTSSPCSAALRLDHALLRELLGGEAAAAVLAPLAVGVEAGADDYRQPLPDLLTAPDMFISCPHTAGEPIRVGGVPNRAVVTRDP